MHSIFSSLFFIYKLAINYYGDSMISPKIGRILFGRLKEGEDLLKSLEDIVRKEDVKSGVVQVIGSLKRINVGYYNREQSKYFNKTDEGTFELVSCIGNISWRDGSPVVHIHMAVSSFDDRMFLGHVLEGNIVDATAEYVIFVFDRKIERKYDESTGLHLLEV